MDFADQLELLPLEREVLAKLLAIHPQYLHLLKIQLESARISSREFTEAGFYLNFDVNGTPKFDLDLELNHVFARIAGLKLGAGFILFIREGLIVFLEGYSYEEPWPSAIDNFEVYAEVQ